MLNIKEIRKENNTILLFIAFFKWILIGTILGAFTGVLITIFLKSLELATNTRLKYTWLLFLLPAGGAFTAFLYKKFGKISAKGNNLIIEIINGEDKEVPFRMMPLIFIGTILTHLFGGSSGREASGVQIGSSAASLVGKILHLDSYDMKLILMSGVASGFAGVFGTPISSTIFALEMASIGSLHYEAIIPCFISSFVGAYIPSLLGVSREHYIIKSVSVNFSNTIKIILAAIIFGLVSKLFSTLSHKLSISFGKYIKNPLLRSAVGGFIIILMVFVFNSREYLGLSTPLMNKAFNTKLPPYTFLLKLIFTSVTLGACFKGGEVTPLFVIGSTLGSFLSGILILPTSLLASLGLIGLFAGAVNTPITALVLGIELFGSKAAVYIFMVSVISYLFSGHTGIYTSQKIIRGKSRFLKTPKNTTLSFLIKSK